MYNFLTYWTQNNTVVQAIFDETEFPIVPDWAKYVLEHCGFDRINLVPQLPFNVFLAMCDETGKNSRDAGVLTIYAMADGSFKDEIISCLQSCPAMLDPFMLAVFIAIAASAVLVPTAVLMYIFWDNIKKRFPLLTCSRPNIVELPAEEEQRFQLGQDVDQRAREEIVNIPDVVLDERTPLARIRF